MPENGYAWWYVDGVSDCGQFAVSVIAFIGSVFSPWYRWSGRRDPDNHCCINVATYGRGGRFAMTDRGRAALRQSETTFTVGPSSLVWRDGRLVIDIDEVSSLPLISRMRGQIVVTPEGVTDVELPLTPEGTHVWRPFAPTSRIEVDLGSDGSGQGMDTSMRISARARWSRTSITGHGRAIPWMADRSVSMTQCAGMEPSWPSA